MMSTRLISSAVVLHFGTSVIGYTPYGLGHKQLTQVDQWIAVDGVTIASWVILASRVAMFGNHSRDSIKITSSHESRSLVGSESNL